MSDARRILIGTSGYSFADWVGPFYPPGMRSSEFLSFYARHFDAVEVNSTYYRIPHPRVMEQMERKTPDGFRFVVKLNQVMTHQGSRDPALYREFVDAGKPVGVICHGAWVLVEADAVRGRRLTSYPSLRTDLTNAGAQWVDEQVVVDGPFVSSRTPDDLPAFDEALIEAVGTAR